MKMNIRTAAALGALALIGTLTAAPAYAAPDRPLAPASVEFKLSPGDDSSDPEPRWKGNGEEWLSRIAERVRKTDKLLTRLAL